VELDLTKASSSLGPRVIINQEFNKGIIIPWVIINQEQEFINMRIIDQPAKEFSNARIIDQPTQVFSKTRIIDQPVKEFSNTRIIGPVRASIQQHKDH
jgi:hypothetical protein